jgi:hypothetical protein
VQRICDGLTGQKIYRFAGQWLARLPHPFTAGDAQAGYRGQLPAQQIEFSATMALDRPVAGRVFFGQLIRGNLGIGRPDKASIVSGRTVRQRGKGRTPGDLPDPGDHQRHLPPPVPVLQQDPGQTAPEGRALRAQATLNQPRDLAPAKN